jgi:hypothetical protein
MIYELPIYRYVFTSVTYIAHLRAYNVLPATMKLASLLYGLKMHKSAQTVH